MPFKLKDETGNTYGRLTVLSLDHKNKNNIFWLCSCDCGNETIVRAGHLRDGTTKSCGCGRSLGDGRSNFNRILSSYKSNAKNYKRKWNIDTEWAWKSMQEKCYYCGSEPNTVEYAPRTNGPFTYNGLDRIDNKRGYETDNVVTCCWDCNAAKGAMTQQEFLGWARRLYENWAGLE